MAYVVAVLCTIPLGIVLLVFPFEVLAYVVALLLMWNALLAAYVRREIRLLRRLLPSMK